MITERYAEERIRSWLIATAPRHLPDRVLTDTYDRTRRMAQASTVRTWWSRVTRPLPIVFAASALAVVVVLVNSRLGSLGGGQEAPRLGVGFGSTAQITSQWTTAGAEAFSVQFQSPEEEHLYWRAAVYDTFDLTAWGQTLAAGYDVAVGDEVLAQSSDAVSETGRRAVTFRVFPTDFRGSSIVSPQSPSKVDTTVRVSYVGDARYFASVDRAGGDPYTVTALVPERSDKEGALTINRLRAAGTTYPPEISRQYLTVPEGAIPPGGDAEKLLDAILAEVDDPDNPYDVASTMVDYLQSPANFKYDADIRDLACEGLSVVECFARFRQGYCQYYASTMAILLREHGIPTRLAAGFLPGERDGLVERVSVSAAHAWVEVYFPGYGWVEFDPTGGGLANPEALPTGEPVP